MMVLGGSVMEETNSSARVGPIKIARSRKAATFPVHRCKQSGRGYAERTTLFVRGYAVFTSFSSWAGAHGGMVHGTAVLNHVLH